MMVPMPTRKSNLLNEFGDRLDVPIAEENQFTVRANHYDVVNRWAQTDQWQYANDRSGDATDDHFTRQRLRSASRFEYANNSYCRGICLKMAQEIIGTGPRLEIEPLTPSPRANQAAARLEGTWQDWSDETCFVEKLQMSVIEEIVGGEIFQMFRQNRYLRTVPVDFQSYEAAQIKSDPLDELMNQDREYPFVDGIRLDRYGNTVGFYKLKANPGSDSTWANEFGDTDFIPADIMVQMFRKERPSQYRGVSQLAPCIELFGKLRRYTEASIETAENAASILGTIETAFQPNQCTPGSPSAIALPFGSGQLMTLPDGWRYNAYKPEQPGTGYSEFKREILHEIISCMLLPWNIASSDSSDFNFASGQLDHRIFERYIKFQRQRQEKRLINRFFRFWMEFATYVPGIIPTGLGAFSHTWYWPGKEPIDPAKLANAVTTLKGGGLLNEQKYWQEQGISAKDAIDQQLRLEAYEQIRRREIGEEMGVNLQQPEPSQSEEQVNDQN